MKCTFVVGQKVVCIAEGNWSGRREAIMYWYGQELNAPSRGDILTIRDIYHEGELIGIRFEEIRNAIHPKSGIEYGFCYWEFAPLETRKTDISIFQQILTDNQVRVLDPVGMDPAQCPRSCAANWAGE